MPQHGLFGNGNYLPKIFSNKDRTTLTRIIVVIGKKNLVFPFSYLISPGSFPNQESNCGANCRITPTSTMTAPIIIIILPILMGLIA
jgi:hypothetical protein